MVKTFDPNQGILIVGIVPVTGFAKDKMITVERDEDAFTKHVGLDGEVTRAKSGNKAGKIKIPLAQSSLSNDYFMSLAALDEAGNSGVVPITYKNLSGTTKAFSAQAWVQKIPPIEEGKDVGEREWVFDCGAIDMFAGGNN